MDIQIGYYPQVIILVLVRVAAIMGTVQFFGGARVAPGLRVPMIVMVTLAMIPAIPVEWCEAVGQTRTLSQMLFAVLHEFLLGAAVGLVIDALMAACLIGGALVGMSSSLMMARSIDPIGGKTNVITGQIIQLSFFCVVLLLNGHLLILKMLSMSFGSGPHTAAWLSESFYEVVVAAGVIAFEWGVRLAMPVLGAAFIVDACLGLLTRLAPDFNVLFLSLPIRILSGLVVLAFVIRAGGGVFERMTEVMLRGCARLLTA